MAQAVKIYNCLKTKMVDGHHLENYISNNAESINAKTG